MFFLVIALSIQPKVYTFDRIEVNHVYNEQGLIRLDQIIYWDFDECAGKWRVVTWRNLPGSRRILTEIERQSVKEKQEDWMPVNDPWLGSPLIPHRKGKWFSATWVETDSRFKDVVITVRTKCFIETHTQYDREIKNRETFPMESRPELWGRRQ